jgi:hypothetical protein
MQGSAEVLKHGDEIMKNVIAKASRSGDSKTRAEYNRLIGMAMIEDQNSCQKQIDFQQSMEDDVLCFEHIFNSTINSSSNKRIHDQLSSCT